MVTSDRITRKGVIALALGCAACTLTGLGDYQVSTCAEPTGTSSSVQAVGSLSSAPSMSTVNGATPMGAFVSNGSSSCVEAVGPNGYPPNSNCSLFKDLSPEQPWVVPLGGGYVAAAVSTTAPCTQGLLTFASLTSSGSSIPISATCGAALPAVVPMPDGNSALVAWYETPVASRSDAIQSCATATAAPLKIAVASAATTANPTLGMPATLTTNSLSVRPPAMAPLYGASQVLIAAPDGGAVSVWAMQNGQPPTSPTATVPGLARATAVSMASATDGSGRIAIVAEIGCAPQSIALALGTLSDGFAQVTTVVPAGSSPAVQPTVAWVPSQSYWIVSWIQAGGGAHALAQRFDTSGNPVGGVIDPSAAATAAAVNSDGSLFAYEPGASGGSFVKTSLGCAQ